MDEKALTEHLRAKYPKEDEARGRKEFKSLKHAINGKAGEDVTSYVSAIANMDGGQIVIGVHDKTLTIVGQQLWPRVGADLEIASSDVNVAIRRCRSADAEPLSEMVEAAFRKAHASILSEEQINKIGQFSYSATSLWAGNWSAAMPLVAVHDGRPVGYVRADFYSRRQLFLWMLYVHPDYQGRGVGSALISTLIAELPTILVLQAEVLRDSHRAVAFYKRQGFEAIAEMPNATSTAGVPSLFMERALQPKQLTLRRTMNGLYDRFMRTVNGAPLAHHRLSRAPGPGL